MNACLRGSASAGRFQAAGSNPANYSIRPPPGKSTKRLGHRVLTVGALAFGSQQFVPGHEESLLYLAFNPTVAEATLGHNDPDGLILEARFVSPDEAVRLMAAAGGLIARRLASCRRVRILCKLVAS